MVKRKICFASLSDAQGSRCQTCHGQSVTRIKEIWAKNAPQKWSIFAITESTVDLTTKYTLDHADFAADSTTKFEMRFWLMCSWVFKFEYAKEYFYSPMLPHERPKTGANSWELRATVGICSCLDLISPVPAFMASFLNMLPKEPQNLLWFHHVSHSNQSVLSNSIISIIYTHSIP